MKKYLNYYKLSLLAFAFYIIIDFVVRKKEYFILAFAFAVVIYSAFQGFEYLSVHGKGIWRIIKSELP